MKTLAKSLFVVLVILGMVGCAPRTGQAAVPTPTVAAPTPVTQEVTPTPLVEGATSTPTVEEPSPTPAPGDSLTVTLDDNGKSIDLPVGTSFLLKLGENYDWEINISDQAVLSRVKNVMVIRGAQGLYEGLQAGQVELTATGDPTCRKDYYPCEQPSIQFTLTVVVK